VGNLDHDVNIKQKLSAEHSSATKNETMIQSQRP